MTTTTNEARTALTKTFIKSVRENGGCTPCEADGDLNDASRAVIAAMHAEHGTAWLGKINLYDKERHGGHPIMWQWTGKLVYNFGASFVAPAYDAELVRLISERDNAVYTGTADDAKRIEAIYQRMTEIGGIHLHWS